MVQKLTPLCCRNQYYQQTQAAEQLPAHHHYSRRGVPEDDQSIGLCGLLLQGPEERRVSERIGKASTVLSIENRLCRHELTRAVHFLFQFSRQYSTVRKLAITRDV